MFDMLSRIRMEDISLPCELHKEWKWKESGGGCDRLASWIPVTVKQKKPYLSSWTLKRGTKSWLVIQYLLLRICLSSWCSFHKYSYFIIHCWGAGLHWSRWLRVSLLVMRAYKQMRQKSCACRRCSSKCHTGKKVYQDMKKEFFFFFFNYIFCLTYKPDYEIGCHFISCLVHSYNL